MKCCLITGVTGQDGAYLARLMLEKGYAVVGTRRGGDLRNLWRLQHLGVLQHPNFSLSENNLLHIDSVYALLTRFEPQEIYHLASPSSVAQSFVHPHETFHAINTSTLNLLESVRKMDHSIRFFLASSSEIFDFSSAPQDENAPLRPRSPYAVGKLNAQWLANNYRECFGVFASIGILFNHESPIRGSQFVTKKISQGAVQVALGLKECFELGNLNAQRDWGYAPEYVECMWRIIQAPTADTYVVASQRVESVRNFVLYVFNALGIGLEFCGSAINEVAVVRSIRPHKGGLAQVSLGQTVMRVSPTLLRLSDSQVVLGNPAKARAELDWVAKTDLNTICTYMVDHELGLTPVPAL